MTSTPRADEPEVDPARGVRRVLALGALVFSFGWCCGGFIVEPMFETADTLDPHGHDLAADALFVSALALVVALSAWGKGGPRVRLLFAYGLLGFVSAHHFRDTETAGNRRFVCVGLLSALAGCQIAARSGDSLLAWKRAALWTAVLTGTVYFANAKWREYAGLEPTSRAACGEPPPNANPFAAKKIPSPSGLLSEDKFANELRARTSDGRIVIERRSGRAPVAVAEWPDERDHILELALTSDGKTLAAAHHRDEGAGSEVTVWELVPRGRGPKCELHLRHTFPLPYRVDTLAFVHNGAALIAFAGHWRARIWDVESGSERGQFAPFGETSEWAFPVQAFAVAPDGNTFATVSWGEGWVWRARPFGHTRRLEIPKNAPARIGFTPDGRYLIVNDADYESHWPLDPSPVPFVAFTGAVIAAVLLGFRASHRVFDIGADEARDTS